jgi:malate permease and related proteins
MIGIGDVLSAVLPVFLLAAIGVLLRKVNWLTHEADESLLRVVVNVLTPCLIFDKVLDNEALKRPENLLVPPLAGFLGIAIGIGLCWLFRRRGGLASDPEQRTFALVAGLQNYGYVPFPLILTLFAAHPDTPGVLFVHNLGVDIAMWTLGLITLGQAGGWREWHKLINAPIVAILVALLLNAAHASAFLPRFVMTTASMLGACAFPLGIMLTGATVADQSAELTPARSAPTIAFASLFRLALIPAVLLGLTWLLPLSVELKRVLVVQAAMPAGVFPIVLARRYGGDPATAVRIVIGTSLVGLVTIPVWLRLGLGWLQLPP